MRWALPSPLVHTDQSILTSTFTPPYFELNLSKCFIRPVDSTANQGGTSSGDPMSIAIVAACADVDATEASYVTRVVPEGINHTCGSGESTVYASVDESSPSVGMVNRPTSREGGDGSVVPGDMKMYAEWVRFRVHLVDLVGHHRGLTNSLRCYQPKRKVSTNELM